MKKRGEFTVTHRGFRFLFWGFIFVFVDFRIQGFDILPDIIGYVFFAVGLGLLEKENLSEKENRGFAVAKVLSYPLIFLSLFSIFQFQAPLNGGFHVNAMVPGLWSVLDSLLFTVLDLLMVFHICKGIRAMANHAGFVDLADKAHRRWIQYLCLDIFKFVALLLAFAAQSAGFLIIWVIVGFIYAIAMTVLMPMLMAECRTRLGGPWFH
jgi:hypothetical protein